MKRAIVGMETSGQTRRALQAKGWWVVSVDLLPADDIPPHEYRRLHLAEWPQANNHEDVKFRGRRLGDLTREELIEALYQALTELKHRNGV